MSASQTCLSLWTKRYINHVFFKSISNNIKATFISLTEGTSHSSRRLSACQWKRIREFQSKCNTSLACNSKSSTQCVTVGKCKNVTGHVHVLYKSLISLSYFFFMQKTAGPKPHVLLVCLIRFQNPFSSYFHVNEPSLTLLPHFHSCR